MAGASAFVPQDDRLHGFCTCEGYLHHYARLSGLSLREDPEPKIKALLQSLGLQEQAKVIVGDVFFKGLSGGQQRRLSVALEALTSPLNFYLDEPTSGLDAESAYQVMEFLKNYARAAPGRRVILTIHQPSSFIWQLLDQVILLSKGQLMFQGSRNEMEAFFNGVGFPTPKGWNPADHYVTLVNDEFRNHALSVPEWAAKFQQWSHSPADQKISGDEDIMMPAETTDRDGSVGGDKELGIPGRDNDVSRTPSILAIASKDTIETHRAKNPFVVVGELTYRYFLNLWFNPGILFTRLAMYAALALMVGLLFRDLGRQYDYASILSRAAVLFYCVSFFIFMSVAVLPFTLIERTIVDKEVVNHYYHPIYYQMSQAVSSIPGTALLAFCVTIIIITLTHLREPYWYFLNMFLSLTVAEALAQLVSHLVPHFVIGMALVAGLYGFFMLFLGFMLVPSLFPLWLKWTYYVAFHTYSWRTFMVNEFRDQTFVGNPDFATGEEVLAYYEIENVNRRNDVSHVTENLWEYCDTHYSRDDNIFLSLCR